MPSATIAGGFFNGVSLKKVPTAKYRLPKSIIHFNSANTTIQSLVTFNGCGKEHYPWADRVIGCFPILSWQRKREWTRLQQVKFVESIFMGYDLGSVIINDFEIDKNGVLRPFSDLLLDGENRLIAILDFLNNRFSYAGYYWNQLNRYEQRRFLDREMSRRTTCSFNEAELRRVYNHIHCTD
ncbi:DUF262 domain-containing protein [Photobacterium leiognathi]|uniref:DUF262 domain-containing protein n=1 Tax=Photobacterium leiognathi TaxID=553611 RepID=UPI0029821978|nr:DUF262 domain-containing protein [Photobacterium leiognathi]